MIDKELQERIKKQVAKQGGQSYPCSNQIVNRVIVLKDVSRIAAFEQAYPNFICYRHSKNGFDNRYIDCRTEELWRMIIASENQRGQRYYKAIIDTTIDKDRFDAIITPSMAHYTCEVDFFEDTV